MQGSAISGTLMEILFPGFCLLCGERLILNSRPFFPVCESCTASLQPIGARRRCRVCSAILISEREVCTRCRDRSFSFGRNHSLFEYRGSIKELIYLFKFKNRRRVALLLSEQLITAYRREYREGVLVPVPASIETLRRRGWDHMDLIGKAMGRKAGLRIERLLKRVGGSAQKGLGFRERRRNIEGTIALRRKPQRLERVVLLDDVFTTGATANECARILIAGGVRRVDVLTLAID